MTPSAINNLFLDELERYTEELIRTGDYGPTIIAVLNKWLELYAGSFELYADSKSAAKLKDKIVTIRGLVDQMTDACDEIKGMRNE